MQRNQKEESYTEERKTNSEVFVDEKQTWAEKTKYPVKPFISNTTRSVDIVKVFQGTKIVFG